jgi:hypothetical protein
MGAGLGTPSLRGRKRRLFKGPRDAKSVEGRSSDREGKSKFPRLDSTVVAGPGASMPDTRERKIPGVAADVAGPFPDKGAPLRSHQLDGSRSRHSRNKFGSMHRSEEPPTPGEGLVSASKGVGGGFPDAGALVVPLARVEGAWSIDWDALRFAANRPALAGGMPPEIFKVWNSKEWSFGSMISRKYTSSKVREELVSQLVMHAQIRAWSLTEIY